MSAVAFIPAVACILTVTDVPAVDDVLAVASFPIDLGVPVLL